jgi:hypothetical protein
MVDAAVRFAKRWRWPVARSVALVMSIGSEVLGQVRTASPNAHTGPTLRLEFTLPRTGAGVFFGAVADAGLMPDGSILVLDAINKTIYRFAADGTFLDSLGRAGRGPGEFVQPRHLAVGRGGEIAAVDGANARVTYWTPDRRLVGTTKIRGWPLGLWWRPSGLFLKTSTIGASGNAISFYRLRPGTETVDSPMVTLTFERNPSTLAMRGVTCDFCAATTTPQGDPVVADPDPVAYRVAQLAEGGAVSRVWGRPGLPPVAFSPSELEQIKAAYARDGLSFDRRQFRVRPRIATLAMDEQGWLWVLRNVPEGERLRLDVFGPDTELLGVLPLPRGVRKVVVRYDRLLAFGETPEGEPAVQVYRIAR